MLVRIFAGASWSAGQVQGDHEFDLLPAIGHKIAIATDDGWDAAVVRDIVHRLTGGDEAADVALLVSVPIDGGDPDDALPLATLDRLAGTAGDASPPSSAAPRGPWGGA